MKTLNELMNKIELVFAEPDKELIKEKDWLGNETGKLLDPVYNIKIVHHKQYFAFVDRHTIKYFIFDDSKFSIIGTNVLDKKGNMRINKQALLSFFRRRDILVEIDTCLLEKNYIFLMAMKHRFYYDYWKSGDKKIFVDKLFLFMADKEAQEKTIVFNRKINIPLLQNKLPDLCLNHSVMKELKKYSEFTNFKINKEFFQTVDKLVKLKSDFKPTGYDARTVKSIHRYQELTKKMNNKKEFDAFLFNNHLTAYNVKELIDMFKSLIDYGYNHQGIISYVRKLRFTNGIKDSKQAVGLLRDYARMHFSMENKDFKKYPKWLKPAHDLVTNLYNVRTSHQQYDKMISERAYKLVEKYSYYGKYFFITAPANHKEIIEDAIVLDHCGSSYIEEHAKENTTILFVRMNGKEETPLCTLEIDVDNNEILQAVCASNSSPKDELKEFIDDFKKHIKRLNNK